nr:MAG: putative coat protein [Tombusviridae sp.]
MTSKTQREKATLERLAMLIAGSSKQTKKKKKRQGKRPGNGSSYVTAPSAGGVITRPRVPRVIGRREGIVVDNTERIAGVGVLVGGATSIGRSDLCPATFNWLNGLAVNYSKYRWLRLQIYYIPICPTTTAGVFAMGLTYDDNDAVTGGTVALVQQMNRSVSGPVWAGYDGASGLNSTGYAIPPGSIAIDVDVDKFDKPYYKYATGAQIAAMSLVDAGIYVPSMLVISSDSGAATQSVGLVMAKYSIELIEPVPSVLND